MSQNLNYIGALIIESYKENIADQNYSNEKEEILLKENTKLDSLYHLFNMDEKNRRSFSKKLGVSYEDLQVFMKVLQRV